jgi:hypothetical protein
MACSRPQHVFPYKHAAVSMLSLNMQSLSHVLALVYHSTAFLDMDAMLVTIRGPGSTNHQIEFFLLHISV